MAGRETSAEINDAAADWAARLDRGALSREEAATLQGWTEGDSRRAGALARAMAVLARVEQVLGPPAANARSSRIGRRDLLFAGGALAAASAGAVVVLGSGLAPQRRRLVSEPGEVRIAMLPDGTRVTLNGGSEVQAVLHRDRRDVTLVRGEAVFDVAKDAARPFVVRAGDLDVRAVGTSFAVRMPERGLRQVLVREGLVDVRRPREAPQRLIAGCWASAPDDREIQVDHVPLARIRAALSWAGDCRTPPPGAAASHRHKV